MPLLPTTCPVCKHEPLTFEPGYAVCDHCHVYRKPLTFWQRPVVWAEGKTWWWRTVLLVWFGVLLARNLHDGVYAAQRTADVISAFDLGIHELGHIVFIPFGEFMTIVGGSLFQCLFPVLWLGVCLKKKWYFAATLCLCWLGLNLFDVAAYAGDARARLLSLATFASDYNQAHDWYQILSRLNMLESDTAVASTLRAAGTAVMASGLAYGAVLIWYILRNPLKQLRKEL